MNIDIEALKELNSLGLLADRPAAAALLAELQGAVADKATLLAKRQAEREAKERAETPIEMPWRATPGAADDMVLFTPDRRPPGFDSVTINGQLYQPLRAHRKIGFLEAALRPALRETSGAGWQLGTVRQAVFLLEALSPSDATACVAGLTSDQVPLVLAIYRAVAHSQRPEARSLAGLAHAILVQFGHPPGSNTYVPNGERAEWQRAEAEAAEIFAMATAGQPMIEEVDRDTEQRRATNEQISNVNDRLSQKAERAALARGES